MVICKICNDSFYVKPSHQKLGWGKCCSAACRAKAQLNGKKFHCLLCGKEIYRSKSKERHSKSGNFFCDKSCQIKWKNSLSIESEHPNWFNGISAYRDILIRSGQEQSCTLCGLKDVRLLSAHHLDHDRTNNALSNLIWLCFNCHYLVHHDDKIEDDLNKKLKNNMVAVAQLV